MVCRQFSGIKVIGFSSIPMKGVPAEPLHIHVIKAEKVAKLWLEPDVAVAESYGMTSSELKMLCKVVKEKRDLIAEVWNEYFGS